MESFGSFTLWMLWTCHGVTITGAPSTEIAHLMHQEAKRGEKMLDFLEPDPSDLTLLTPTPRSCL